MLNWRITVGLSLWSLGFNLLYFWLVSHRLRDTLVLSASSLFVLGAAHLAHSVQK